VKDTSSRATGVDRFRRKKRAVDLKERTHSVSRSTMRRVHYVGRLAAIAFLVGGISCSSDVSAAKSSSVPPPPLTGSGEPVYDPASQSLILTDNFDQYATKTALMNAYPIDRNFLEYGELITGRGGAGHAARLNYGIGAADDILFGPEGRLGSVGSWNGTLPQKAGPYRHIYFSTWFRVTAGSDPTENDYSGIKGFMMWNTAGARYQNAVNKLSQSGGARGPKGANPDNATSGFNLYKTPDGKAPLWSTYSDGNWHRFTIEVYAGGDPSGHFGERYWVDGALIYSDIDLHVGTGTLADHYDYASPVSHWMVFGNFVNASARSNPFSFDVDDWMAWTQ